MIRAWAVTSGSGEILSLYDSEQGARLEAERLQKVPGHRTVAHGGPYPVRAARRILEGYDDLPDIREAVDSNGAVFLWAPDGFQVGSLAPVSTAENRVQAVKMLREYMAGERGIIRRVTRAKDAQDHVAGLRDEWEDRVVNVETAEVSRVEATLAQTEEKP